MKKYRIAYGFFLLLLLVLAVTMRDRYFVSMLLSALILPLLSFLWTFFALKYSTLTAQTIQHTPKKWQVFFVKTTITSPRWFCCPDISLHLFPKSDACVQKNMAFCADQALDEAEDVSKNNNATSSLSTLKNRATHLEVTLQFHCCGQFSLAHQELKATDFLHLFCLRKKIGQHKVLLIYPNICTIHLDAQPLKQQNAIQTNVQQNGTADESNIIGYKIYQDHDDMRHIHWKLSARGDDFLTKQFFISNQSKTLLMLDLSPVSYTDDTPFSRCYALDCMIETSVSLLWHYFNQGEEVSLLYVGEKLQYEQMHSLPQLEQFYEQSPLLGRNATIPLAQLLTYYLQFEQGGCSQIFLISPCIDFETMHQIHRIIAVGGVVFLIDCADFPPDQYLKNQITCSPNVFYYRANQLYFDLCEANYQTNTAI